jgi:bifunctional enzyme CysN/CysC
VYAKADSGEIANFPGVSAEYETPTSPDVVLPVHQISIDECANRVIEVLEARGVL